MQIRYNIMDINSMQSFAQITGGVHQGCKDVYFVAACGVNEKYIDHILEMDITLTKKMDEGKGYYQRYIELPVLVKNNDILFYTNCYEQWITSQMTEVKIKICASEDSERAYKISELCKIGEKKYQEVFPNASETMKKNFMIKVLHWLDFVFADRKNMLDDNCSTKLVVHNVNKRQELLFWFLISQLGKDVLILQNKSELDEIYHICNLKKIVLGEYKEVTIPLYSKSIQREHIVSPVSEMSNEKVKVVIPQKQGRNCTTINNGNIERESKREEKSFEELAKLATSVVLIAIHDEQGNVIGTGSGIMIGRKGYILTNNHVACGGKYYSVKIEDDDTVYKTAEVIKYNSVLDLAIIRIQRELAAIPMYRGEKKLVRGQSVVAIGSPLGLFNSVSNGIISGFRTMDSVDMIQFTAPISHGSSGGALLNMYGEIIGISTAGFDEGQNINLAVGYENINMFIHGFTDS